MYSLTQWIFRGIYLLLLARLILNWVALNRRVEQHPVAQLIEKISDPLVAPFRGLFQSRFDFSPALTYFILSMIVEPLVHKVLGL